MEENGRLRAAREEQDRRGRWVSAVTVNGRSGARNAISGLSNEQRLKNTKKKRAAHSPNDAEPVALPPPCPRAAAVFCSLCSFFFLAVLARRWTRREMRKYKTTAPTQRNGPPSAPLTGPLGKERTENWVKRTKITWKSVDNEPSPRKNKNSVMWLETVKYGFFLCITQHCFCSNFNPT